MAQPTSSVIVAVALAVGIGTPVSFLHGPKRGELAEIQVHYEYEERIIDVIAGHYLPDDSQAHGSLFMDCGNPVLDFQQRATTPLPERVLVLRALEIQARVVPNELIDGPKFDPSRCLTPQCSGIISLSQVPFIRFLASGDNP